MKAAYVDSSCIVAVAFGEKGSARVRQSLLVYDELFSSNLLEAELRSALKSAGSGGIVTLVLYNKAGASQGNGRRVERVQLVP